MNIEFHPLSDGSVAAERVGGEMEAWEDADSLARPVGREGRIDHKYKIQKGESKICHKCIINTKL